MAFKLVSVEPSKRKFKKFKAFFHDAETNKHKTSHFGDNRYVDYTILSAKGDPTAKEHRDRYRQRHEKDLAGEPTSPGVLSYMLLWNKPTLQASIASYKKLFHM
jgi:hypothetical protein